MNANHARIEAKIFFFLECDALPRPFLALQVMVAMELCTNGALREALKLNICWPLKVSAFCVVFRFLCDLMLV